MPAPLQDPPQYDPNRFVSGLPVIDKPMELESGPISRLYDVKKIHRQHIFPYFWTANGTLGATNRSARVRLADNVQTYVDWTFVVNKDYPIMDIILVWSSPAASGNMWCEFYFHGTAMGYADNNSITSNASFTISNTQGASNFNYTSLVNQSGLAFSSLNKFDYVSAELVRNGAHANDTLNNVADIFGLLLIFR